MILSNVGLGGGMFALFIFFYGKGNLKGIRRVCVQGLEW